MKKLKNFVQTGLMLFAGAVLSFACYNYVVTKQNCVGHLELAAHANTVDLALSELQIATTYLEQEGLTTGYTSIFWKTPDENIGFWYQNLKSAEAELAKVDSTTTQLERTNILLKLRETLMRSNDGKDSVIVPPGLSRYPYNFLLPLAILGILVTLFLDGSNIKKYV